MAGIVYTVGTSTRSLDDFLQLIRGYSIDKLVDVRRFPRSQFDHFRSEKLKQFLRTERIEYVWMGESLGGYRKGGYEAYTRSEQFKKGVDTLEKEVVESTAFFCAEIVPWRCHRRYIARELVKRGWKVIHIIDERRTMEEQ